MSKTQIKREQVFSINYTKTTVEMFPEHQFISNWIFEVDKKCSEEEYKKNEDDVHLANAMAKVAENNGMSANDMQHLFPAVLRMLKSNSAWSK